ncbi:MAG: CobW family GTP-binding protein [Lawsonibacter sp.]|jgi:G3E family GTPase
MTQIDIISGFLGAGKTTLIKKLLSEAFQGEKIVLIENEFGEIGIDGGFLKDAGIEITEMNSGCICCSLVGDFGTALKKVLEDYAPDRIVIEPSGVGKLSDVIAAVERVQSQTPDLALHSFVTVVDAGKAKVYMKNFGEFFNNQVEHASAILLSRTQKLDPVKLEGAVRLLREKNPKAAILTTPWDQLSGQQIVAAMEGGHSLAEELMEEIQHHHHEHPEDCSCGCHDHDHGHHHDHDQDHDHHDHDHEHHNHEHHHDHDHDEGTCTACLTQSSCDAGTCTACSDHHHHHHGHDADEVFTSWGRETARKYTREELQEALSALAMEDGYGYILRAKGMVPCAEEEAWLHFDLVPGEFQIRAGGADYTGRLCVIGSDLHEEKLETLFHLA